MPPAIFRLTLLHAAFFPMSRFSFVVLPRVAAAAAWIASPGVPCYSEASLAEGRL
ncbi:MAG: hypothetical protein HRU01_27890 [Myxococcales bacterium]|nr:hypothetical protein [Myxococcales bacterium]